MPVDRSSYTDELYLSLGDGDRYFKMNFYLLNIHFVNMIAHLLNRL